MITLTATIAREGGDPIVLDYRNSLSIERSIFDRSDISMPSWGVISNGGKLKFVDTDGSIRALAEARLLKSGMAVTITLSNTISGASAPVGEFLTENWDYDNDRHNVSVSIKDELLKWQDILFSPIKYNPYAQKNWNGREIYEYLRNITPTEFDMSDFYKLDELTQTHLSNSSAEFFILDSKNLWSAWNTFCEAFQTHIYINNQNRTVCKYNGGN